MSVKQILDIIQQVGGWGVAAIAIYALIRVYLDKAKESKSLGELLEKRHEQFIAMLEESIRLKTSLTDLMTRNLDMQEKLIELLARVDRAISGCEGRKDD